MTATLNNSPRSAERRTARCAPPRSRAAPNPFVGLRVCDMLATVQQIAMQALTHPTLLRSRRRRSLAT